MNTIWSLRGFAIIGVCLFHGGFSIPDLMCFFFIISGFTTAFSCHNKKIPKMRQYYANKINKLLPVHVVGLGVSLPLFFLQCGENWTVFLGKSQIGTFFLKLFLLDSYIPIKESVFWYNGLSWFLSSLTLFYLLFPIIWKWIVKNKQHIGIRHLIFFEILVFIVILLIDVLIKKDFMPYSVKWWFTYISPYCRIWQCLFGFLAGLIFINIKEYFNIHRIKWEKPLFTILELAVIYFWLTMIAKSNTYLVCLGNILLNIIFGFEKGLLSDIISLKIFIRIGKLSTYIYMFHLLILNYFYILVGGPISSYPKSKWLMIYILIFIISLSELLDRYLNRMFWKFKTCKRIKV